MKMAAYEAVFGDSALFSAHMHSLSLMLKIEVSLNSWTEWFIGEDDGMG
jgi:hypothetical protein